MHIYLKCIAVSISYTLKLSRVESLWILDASNFQVFIILDGYA